MLFFQPALMRAARIDQLLQSDRIDEAIGLMSQGTAKDLPPTWDPPPKATDRYEVTPSLTQLLDSIEGTSSSPWIIQRLLARADLIAPRQFGIHHVSRVRDISEPCEILGSMDQLQSLDEIIDRILAVDAIDENLRNQLLDLRASVTFSRDAARERQKELNEQEEQEPK